MARRLRLHFAARRSNTDPLSETLNHGPEDALGVPARSPGEGPPIPNSFHMKVTSGQLALALPPLSPDYGSLQRHTTVFVPKVNSAGGCKKSMVQISLQASGKQNGDLDSSTGSSGGDEADPGNCDGNAGASSDGGSCSSSTASDVGYCSSSSIFETDVLERKAQDSKVQDRGPGRRKAKVPLRRCSSLVIFPRSPCTTPPASPVSPVAPPLIPPLHPSARSSFQTSHQLQLSAADASQDEAQPKVSVASAVNGLRLSKSSCPPAEFRDAKPILHCRALTEPSPSPQSSERAERHSSVLVHYANQPPLPPGKGNRTTVNIECSKLQEQSEDAGTRPANRNPKLFRSTSACGLPTGKLTGDRRHHTCPTIGKSDVPQDSHRGLQRSISLEVPCSSAGISCHMSNTKQPCFTNGTAHVHIHVSRGSTAKVLDPPKDACANDKRDQAFTFSGETTAGTATVRILILQHADDRLGMTVAYTVKIKKHILEFRVSSV